MLWLGNAGGCAWACFRGESADADWAALAEHQARQLRPVVDHDVAGARAFLVVMDHASPPTARQRKIGSDMVAANQAYIANLHAFALVTDSALVRGALTAVNWVVKQSFSQRVFATPADALAWLREKSSSVNAQAVRDDIRRTVSGK